MFRQTARNIASGRSAAINCRASPVQLRGVANKQVEDASQAAGEAKDTNPQNPSVVSSGGAIGKQFNPEGSIGQVGEKIGGPFSKDGAIGSQFDASKDGIAGQVEKAVDGPVRPATGAPASDPKIRKADS